MAFPRGLGVFFPVGLTSSPRYRLKIPLVTDSIGGWQGSNAESLKWRLEGTSWITWVVKGLAFLKSFVRDDVQNTPARAV